MSQAIVEHLITLKFNIEKEINTINDNDNYLKMLKQIPPEYNKDFQTISAQYKSNIESHGKPYLNTQMELLNEINKQLEKLCQHEWVDDVIDEAFKSWDYCYCQKCFIRQKPPDSKRIRKF